MEKNGLLGERLQRPPSERRERHSMRLFCVEDGGGGEKQGADGEKGILAGDHRAIKRVLRWTPILVARQKTQAHYLGTVAYLYYYYCCLL